MEKSDYSEKVAAILTHNDKEIKGFFGDYRFLSNYHLCQTEYEGLVYPSTEHAYQAAKWPQNQRTQFLNITSAESKQLGKKAPLNIEEWDKKKDIIMFELLWQKFIYNKELGQKLKDTGDKYLEETNYWNDKYWGVCKGEGQNKLGKMLMIIRDFIK